MEPSGTLQLLLVLGAAALLLWGTRMVRTGVTRAFGSEMRHILSKGLSNRLVAAGSGALAAASLQSSTAVALLIVSFIKGGMLRVPIGLALILGADVGSAVIASLLTLDVKRFWPVFIFVGYILHTVYDGTSIKGKQAGRVLLGVGLILLALNSMSALSADLSESPTIHMLMQALAGEPLLAIIIVAALTWIAHSSIAMLLFVAALASAGLLADPALVLAMVLGINVGGAIPAITLTLADPPEARRVPLGNGLFRLSGAALALLVLPLLVEVYSALPGDASFRTIVAHILFNLCLLVLFLPLIYPVARLLARLLPARPADREEEAFGPLYISSTPPDTLPSLALSSLVRETLRMIDLVEEMVRASIDTLMRNDRAKLLEIARLDDQIDTLYEAIKAYATELTRQELEQDESRRAIDILSYATSLENAGDVIDKSLVDIIDKKIKANAAFSPEGVSEIKQLYAYLLDTARLAAAATMNWSAEEARQLLHRKRSYKRMVGQSSQSHLERLRLGDARSLQTSSYHLDIIGDLQRINSLFASIAYAIIGSQTDPEEQDDLQSGSA